MAKTIKKNSKKNTKSKKATGVKAIVADRTNSEVSVAVSNKVNIVDVAHSTLDVEAATQPGSLLATQPDDRQHGVGGASDAPELAGGEYPVIDAKRREGMDPTLGAPYVGVDPVTPGSDMPVAVGPLETTLRMAYVNIDRHFDEGKARVDGSTAPFVAPLVGEDLTVHILADMYNVCRNNLDACGAELHEYQDLLEHEKNKNAADGTLDGLLEGTLRQIKSIDRDFDEVKGYCIEDAAGEYARQDDLAIAVLTRMYETQSANADELFMVMAKQKRRIAELESKLGNKPKDGSQHGRIGSLTN